MTSDFVEGLRVQGRVILALMLRESKTRFGKHKLGYLWALIEPLVHTGIFIMLFTFLARQVALGDSVHMFLATGFSTYFGFKRVLSRTETGYRGNESLLTFPPVKIIDVFAGRALLELATWIVVTTILIGGFIALGYGPAPRSVLMMLAAIVALFAIGFGFGTVVGIVTEFVPSVANIMRAPQRLLYFASGIFFLPEMVPPAFRDIIVWNPLLHGITLFRMGYYEYYDSFTYDGDDLWGWALGCVFFAFVAERIARKPLRALS
jgi:capsular polysaccharide transport system permease protein